MTELSGTSSKCSANLFYYAMVLNPRSEMARRFSSLEMLDSEPVAAISFDAPQTTASVSVKKPDATSFPFPMSGTFITGVDGQIVSAFLVR